MEKIVLLEQELAN